MATMTSAFGLRAINPLRPVDWRLLVAADRVERGLSFPNLDWDELTSATASYLRRARRGEDFRRLAADFPHLHAALQVYRDTQCSPRWALEAWLMTGSPAAEIAATFGLDPAVIECYEAVCFDIRDRLECVDLVFRRLLNRPVTEVYDFRDLGWKRVAYYGGVGALSELFGFEREAGFHEVVRSNSSATKLAAVLRLRRLVETVHLEPRELREVAKAVDDLGDVRDDKGDEYCQQVMQLLGGIELKVLSQKKIQDNPEFQCSVEMRADEQMLAAWGLPTPFDEIKGLTWDDVTAGRQPEKGLFQPAPACLS
jgi:hypothetical protein